MSIIAKKYFIFLNIISFFWFGWILFINFRTIRYLFLSSIMNYYGNSQTEAYSNTLSIIPMHIIMYFIAFLFFIIIYVFWIFFFYINKILYIFEYFRLFVFFLFCVIFFSLFWYYRVWTYFYDVVVYLFWVSSSTYDLIFDVGGSSYFLWVYLSIISFSFFFNFLIFMFILYLVHIKFIQLYFILRLVYFASLILFLIVFIPDAVTHIVLMVVTFFIFEDVLFFCLFVQSLKRFSSSRLLKNYKNYVFLLHLSYKLN